MSDDANDAVSDDARHDVSIPQAAKRWDLFCRVVDNLGDAAIMWRLARQLAREHRCSVQLFVDQPEVLQRLVPQAAPHRAVDGVDIRPMPDDAAAGEAFRGDADVVVTGFHARLPAGYRRAMKPRQAAWINLEYLSAETWIDDFHGLPSPQPDGLTEHYFYPGFTQRSGGLLREADLLARRDAFLADAARAKRFLAELGVVRAGDETLASLLCYPDAPLGALAHGLAGSAARLHLLVPEDAGIGPVDAAALGSVAGGRLRITRIPFVAQYEYDRVLWSCDLNFVRGEDSWVRAVWSGKPFIWQIYKQQDAVHLRKLEAFLGLLQPGLLAEATRWWNAAPDSPARALVQLAARPALALACLAPLARCLTAPDLASRLLDFAAAVRRKNLAVTLPSGSL